MKMYVHGKDVNVSQKTEDLIREKLSFLDQYFLISDADSASVVLKKVNSDIRVEITVTTRAGILRSEVTDQDLRTALNHAVDKLKRQIESQKSRLNRRHKESLAKSFVEKELQEEEKATIPVRTKWIVAQEMSLDEAILQMEMLGHTFFIYTDEDDGKISVVYRRYEGGYGVIEVQSEQ